GGHARRPSPSRAASEENESQYVSTSSPCGHPQGSPSDRGHGSRTRLPGGTAGRGLSEAGRRAHLSDRRAGVQRSKRGPGDPRRRYPPRRRAGLTVSRFERKAFRPSDRTATEARVRFPKGDSVFQAEPERWSGIRTRDTMLKRHLLYPSELSSWLVDRNRTGVLRAFPALCH